MTQTEPNKEPYLRVKDIMEIYKVSGKTVRRWMKAGMPYMKVGKQILRFDKELIEEWIDRNINC